ncbi:MAG TPA: hypothetical protein VH969_05995 [Actinophytocola sp.]|uniref:hypothetical protein n=1 Tax=Actinophytocola sp. TaxID=1872138 RepID=UPI002F93AD53
MLLSACGAALLTRLALAGVCLAKRLAAVERWARTGHVVRRCAVVAIGVATAYLAATLPDVFPSLAIPGVLDGRSVSGLMRPAPFGLETLMLMALAVHLLHVTVTSARERREPARVEAAG